MIICDRCGSKDAIKSHIQTNAHCYDGDDVDTPKYRFDIDLCGFCRTEYAKIIADFRKPLPLTNRS